MKKIAIIITCLSVITSLVACSNSSSTNANANERATTPTSNTATEIITGEVSVTGKVTQIYGNELILRLAENSTPEVGENSSTERPNMTEMSDEERTTMRENMSTSDEGGISSMRENMTEISDEERTAMRENMSTSDEGGISSMRENMTEMSDEERTAMRENATSQRGQKATDESEVATSSVTATQTVGENIVSAMSITPPIIFNGGGGGADRSNMTDADREAMMSQMGDRTSSTGGNTSSISVSDIVLTNDLEEYTIPVGTPVYSYGTALSFSQISKDAYITIYMNKEGTIVSVNILS